MNLVRARDFDLHINIDAKFRKIKKGGNMFGFGHWELLIILVLVLIIFGAGKLPEIGSGIGKSIRNFRKGVAGVETEIKEKTEKIEAD
jgi:sec-independent protein translocase protein TatA